MAKLRTATYFTIKDAEGELKSIGETQFNKMTEDAKTSGTDAPEAVRQQTFSIHEAESVEDILEVCPDADVAVDLFNRGATLKQLNEIRDLMESEDFATVEGSYDLLDVITRKTERRKMSPLDKVLKALGGLSDEERQNVVAKLLAAQSA